MYIRSQIDMTSNTQYIKSDNGKLMPLIFQNQLFFVIRKVRPSSISIQEVKLKVKLGKLQERKYIQEGKHIVPQCGQTKTSVSEHNIALHLKPGYPLRKVLVAPKDKLQTDEKQFYVYVRCEGCGKDYVRESEQSLSTRMTEHKMSDLKVNEKSVMCTHHLEIQHTFNHVNDVNTEPTKYHHKVIEAIHIRLKDGKPSQEEGVTCCRSTYLYWEETGWGTQIKALHMGKCMIC